MIFTDEMNLGKNTDLQIQNSEPIKRITKSTQ